MFNDAAIDPPKWWKYVVLASSFLCHVIIWGFALSAGAFQAILINEFRSTASVSWLSMVSSMVPALTCLAGPVSSFLTGRYGCRSVGVLGSLIATFALIMSFVSTNTWHLLLSFALLGIGLGVSYMPCVVAVCDYFDEGRPLAIGLATTGLGVGSLLSPVLIRLLVECYFWKNSTLLFAGATLNISTFSMCFWPIRRKRPNSDDFSDNEDSEKITPIRRIKIWNKISFSFLIVNNFLLLFGIMAFYVHLPSHLNAIDYTDLKGAIFLSIIGAGTIVGRLMVGFLVRFYPRPLTLYMVSLTMGGSLMILVPYFRSPQTLTILCFSFGLCTSTLGPLLPLIISNLVGPETMASGYGFLLVAEGLGSLCGPPFAGFLYDTNGNYHLSMVECGLVIVLASLIMILPRSFRFVESHCKYSSTGDDNGELGNDDSS